MYRDLYDNIVRAVESKDIKILLIREGEENGKVIGFTMFHKIVSSGTCIRNSKSTYVAEYVRERDIRTDHNHRWHIFHARGYR